MKGSITIVRHGESTANSGQDDCVDAPLTELGIRQAKALRGSFDLIVCSPLRRAWQTLSESDVRLEHRFTVADISCRERVIAPRDTMVGETFREETDAEFHARVARFQIRIDAWTDVFQSVLVIGHAYFFAACFDIWGIRNGEMVEITRRT